MSDTTEHAARAHEIIDAHMHLEGPMLPILHAIQAEFGYVPQDMLPIIAERLNISRAEAHGVKSFYHDFRDAPAGKHVIKVCRAEACQAMGANHVADQIRARLGVDWGETTADGGITLEPVYCLGLCASGPAAMVNGQLEGRVTADRLDEILSEVGA